MLTMMVAHAQWRVGVTGGTDYNVFSMDRQYQTDFRTDGRWGITMGVTSQYDFNSWFGVRADLNWSQKNHRDYKDLTKDIAYKYRNDYMQLPVMASFSFGSDNLRGFCNLGVYGAYWLNSHVSGCEYNYDDSVKWDNLLDESNSSAHSIILDYQNSFTGVLDVYKSEAELETYNEDFCESIAAKHAEDPLLMDLYIGIEKRIIPGTTTEKFWTKVFKANMQTNN